jgi:type IV pilus assembly protein PilA
MSKPAQTGFTLIEIMIVVGIIGILSALAFPAYQNYTIRAQVTEGLSLADGWKAAIGEYYANTGAWPSQGDLNGTAQSVGKYVSNITINSGMIQITYGGSQANQNLTGVLTLVPYTSSNDDILWQCGLAPAPAGTIAVGAAPADTSTTLTVQQLPSSCH